MDDIVFDIVVNVVENLPKARKRDPDAIAESVRRAVRSSLSEQWGKKTMCYVHILQVEQ
jgi:ribonuclease J